MASLSDINLIGNLTRDAETRYTQSRKMNVQFSIAVNKRRGNGEEGVNFYRVTAWGKLAEILDNLSQQGALIKGKPVYVSGDLDARDYQTQQGETRTSLDVFAARVQLVGVRTDGDQGHGQAPGQRRGQHDTYDQFSDPPF